MGCKMTDEESERLTVLAETDGLTLGEWCRHVLLARADSERPRTIRGDRAGGSVRSKDHSAEKSRAARIAVIQ